MSENSRRKQIEELLEAEPNDAELNYFLAMEYLSESKEDEAIQQLSRLVEIQPEYSASYLQLGQLLMQQGEEEQAKDILTRGVAVARKNGEEHAANEMSGFLAMLG